MIKRFSVLDSFRGLFAFIVAIYHYKASGPVGQLALFQQGDYFVDFFFVLSGFIIYHNYTRLTAGTAQLRFMQNRFYRLYPLHIVMLLVFLVMEVGKWVLYSKGLFKNPVFERNNLTTFIYNIFFVQSFSQTSAGWNYPSWSISAEMITYLVFCLLIVYVNRLQQSGRAVSFLLVSLISLGLIYLIKGDLDIKMTNNFSMVRCMYGFFGGCLTYEVYKTIAEKAWVKTRSISLLEGVTLSASLLLTAYMPEPLTFLLPICFAVCVLVFALEGGVVSRLLNNKLLNKVGELSYSIYMTHAAIAIVFEIALGILKVKSPIVLTGALMMYLITIFQVSRLTHHYIEVNLRKWLQKRFGTQPPKPVLQPEPVRIGV